MEVLSAGRELLEEASRPLPQLYCLIVGTWGAGDLAPMC